MGASGEFLGGAGGDLGTDGESLGSGLQPWSGYGGFGDLRDFERDPAAKRRKFGALATTEAEIFWGMGRRMASNSMPAQVKWISHEKQIV